MSVTAARVVSRSDVPDDGAGPSLAGVDTDVDAGTATRETSILIVDDHEFVAVALANLLEMEPGVRVVATTGDGARALSLVSSGKVDVVVLDVRLAGGSDGTDLIPDFLRAAPDLKVLMLSAWGDARSLARAVEAGCHGYVLKDQTASELVRAVLAVADGETVFAPALLPQVLGMLRPKPMTQDALTARENEILQMLADGASTAQIAEALYLSVNTVRNHVHSLIRKLGVHSRLEAVAHGIRSGLVTVH
jgi:DNA-binding NarL/FixJ family response regulator